MFDNMQTTQTEGQPAHLQSDQSLSCLLSEALDLNVDDLICRRDGWAVLYIHRAESLEDSLSCDLALIN